MSNNFIINDNAFFQDYAVKFENDANNCINSPLNKSHQESIMDNTGIYNIL